MTAAYRYYEDPDVTLWCGRCEEVLPALDADSVDMVLTDPPYGMDYYSGHRGVHGEFGRIAGDDGTLDVTAALALALRPLRKRRHLYVFGPEVFGALPITGRSELVWAKPGGGGRGDTELPWITTHERIGFGVSMPEKFNRDKGGGNALARRRRGSVLSYAAIDGKVLRHPSEKPVGLLRELIEASSRFGEVVLDLYAGVGSVGVAAKIEGRRAVLIELEERYCEVAAGRLRQQTLPLAM